MDNLLRKINETSDLIAKLLTNLLDGSKSITELMYKSKMNSKQIHFYTGLLVEKQLVTKGPGLTASSQTRDVYSITSKGMEVLKLIKELRSLIQ